MHVIVHQAFASRGEKVALRPATVEGQPYTFGRFRTLVRRFMTRVLPPHATLCKLDEHRDDPNQRMFLNRPYDDEEQITRNDNEDARART